MELEQLVKMGLFILVLLILVGMAILLLNGKGGELLDSVRRMMRFGR